MTDALTVIAKHQEQFPVDVYQAMGELGLTVTFRPMPDAVAGYIEAHFDGGYGAVINAAHPSTRQRFTAAHQLGHFIYHRDLLGLGVGDTRHYRGDGSPLPNARIGIVHERQASTFAANLLMPYAIAVQYRNAQSADLPRIADSLGVTVAVLRIRLGLPEQALDKEMTAEQFSAAAATADAVMQ